MANALSPAKVIRVDVYEDEKMTRVIVPDHQLSLAIGKKGQNARLAAKLTNWKIDIKSESEDRAEELSDDEQVTDQEQIEAMDREGQEAGEHETAQDSDEKVRGLSGDET